MAADRKPAQASVERKILLFKPYVKPTPLDPVYKVLRYGAGFLCTEFGDAALGLRDLFGRHLLG